MKHKTTKLLCSVLAFCQLFAMTAFARPDWPSDTGIQAEAGALMDVDSGTMIFGQNSHVEYPPCISGRRTDEINTAWPSAIQ